MSPKPQENWKSVWNELAQGQAPTRWHARALLLALGQALLEGREADSQAIEAKLGSLAPALRPAWVRSVQDELNMACTEHVRSADPRYLSRPDYDWGYTLAAREELEARLRAVEALDIEIPSALLEQVQLADARIAPFLKHEPPPRG